MKKVSAVILAAGSGKRIGIPKLKLKYKDGYFINIIINKLLSSGVEDIVSVIRKDDEDWFDNNAVHNSYAINKNPELGMFSSVKIGINHFPKAEGVIIFPVDHPFVNSDTISGMLDSFKNNSSFIIKPYCNGKSGHPLILPSGIFHTVLESGISSNLNSIVTGSGLEILRYETEDEGIFKNVNYPEDLSE